MCRKCALSGYCTEKCVLRYLELESGDRFQGMWLAVGHVINNKLSYKLNFDSHTDVRLYETALTLTWTLSVCRVKSSGEARRHRSTATEPIGSQN